MKDLANLTKISSKYNIFIERSEEPLTNRGISLFLPVPLNRTCKSAGIDPHWCSCDSYNSSTSSISFANKIGKFVVRMLNSWLANFPLCSRFSLRKVFVLETKSENFQSMEVNSSFNGYRIVFSVKPGNGEFEATVFHSDKGKLTMSEEISRISPYGQQSHCIKVYSMKKICYCKKQKQKKKKRISNSTKPTVLKLHTPKYEYEFLREIPTTTTNLPRTNVSALSNDTAKKTRR